MIVQWYSDEPPVARIFAKHGTTMLAELPCSNGAETDKILQLLGWRRRCSWQKREWGFEASLRRMP